ncbi:tail fiber like-protein [Psychromonas sp. PRT-SC03]|nr:tail fiber like-protein [Psychromonas sp. PRT-SC03]
MSLIITDAGLNASIDAGELGVNYKITHIAIGLKGYKPAPTQTALKEEVVREAITRGAVVGAGQLHFETVFAGEIEFEGKEIGYFLEDGTLFAVDSREGEIMSLKRTNTIITEAFELNLANSAIDNITVEIMGTQYATETVAGIAKIVANEQVDSGSDDTAFLTIKKLKRALDAPYLINKLVNNLWLKLAAKIFPVGAGIPWFSDIAPDGFAVMKSQKFDLTTYPELAKIWPDGRIPDMRGCGVIGANDGETISTFEAGQVKKHGHGGSSVNSTNLGSKTTNTKGNHNHRAMYQAGGKNYDGTSGLNGRILSEIGNTSAAGEHNHSVVIGSHAHSISIALFGALKNTIDHRKVNWIVRMA